MKEQKAAMYSDAKGTCGATVSKGSRGQWRPLMENNIFSICVIVNLQDLAKYSEVCW